MVDEVLMKLTTLSESDLIVQRVGNSDNAGGQPNGGDRDQNVGAGAETPGMDGKDDGNVAVKEKENH